jgi:CheY-like chemotaxis protein
MMLRRLLARLFPGSVIDEAEDGADAVRQVLWRAQADEAAAPPSLPAPAAVGATGYHVVLMDASMPVLDGYEATRELRSPRVGYRGLVVGVTGNALAPDVEAFLAAGADCVHCKPVSSAALAADIRRRVRANAAPAPPADADVTG